MGGIAVAWIIEWVGDGRGCLVVMGCAAEVGVRRGRGRGLVVLVDYLLDSAPLSEVPASVCTG